LLLSNSLVPGSEFQVPGSCSWFLFVVRGSSCVIRRAWFVVCGSFADFALQSLGAAFGTFRLDSLRVGFRLRGLETYRFRIRTTAKIAASMAP
jgi:hypothetical protein